MSKEEIKNLLKEALLEKTARTCWYEIYDYHDLEDSEFVPTGYLVRDKASGTTGKVVDSSDKDIKVKVIDTGQTIQLWAGDDFISGEWYLMSPDGKAIQKASSKEELKKLYPNVVPRLTDKPYEDEKEEENTDEESDIDNDKEASKKVLKVLLKEAIYPDDFRGYMSHHDEEDLPVNEYKTKEETVHCPGCDIKFPKEELKEDMSGQLICPECKSPDWEIVGSRKDLKDLLKVAIELSEEEQTKLIDKALDQGIDNVREEDEYEPDIDDSPSFVCRECGKTISIDDEGEVCQECKDRKSGFASKKEAEELSEEEKDEPQYWCKSCNWMGSFEDLELDETDNTSYCPECSSMHVIYIGDDKNEDKSLPIESYKKEAYTPSKLPEGAEILKQEGDIVLAKWNKGDHIEFVTWLVTAPDIDSVVQGHYTNDLEDAMRDFRERVENTTHRFSSKEELKKILKQAIESDDGNPICDDCNWEGEIDPDLPYCPECGSMNISLTNSFEEVASKEAEDIVNEELECVNCGYKGPIKEFQNDLEDDEYYTCPKCDQDDVIDPNIKEASKEGEEKLSLDEIWTEVKNEIGNARNLDKVKDKSIRGAEEEFDIKDLENIFMNWRR